MEEIPFGKHKIEVAMKLREAMLINGLLYNSEAWHGVTKKHIESLEAIDQALLRNILNSHSKTPTEFLYLESGAVPIRWIIAQRRILFLKHIMRKHDQDLVKQVFLAQQASPTQGDFVTLVRKDLDDLKITYEEVTSSVISTSQLKDKLKKNAIDAAFVELKLTLSTHKKVKQIHYSSLKMQSYLKSDLLSCDEKKQLTNFRAQCVRTMKTHFKKMYKNASCPLQCSNSEDTPEHLLDCPKIKHDESHRSNISQIFQNVTEQEHIGKVLSNLMRQRLKILKHIEESNSI